VPWLLSSPLKGYILARVATGTDYGHGDTSSELNAVSRFKAMEGLDPQIKRKILSDNPRRFYGI
jgi:predicted TIM-barrel fold metal-dependent hydrolase